MRAPGHDHECDECGRDIECEPDCKQEPEAMGLCDRCSGEAEPPHPFGCVCPDHHEESYDEP